MQRNYDFIQTTTKDGIKLSGLFQAGNKQKDAVILIHGFTADFYSHKFYHIIADHLKEQSNALILAQTRGTGLHTEFTKEDGSSTHLGSYYEKLEEAHYDISAFVEFLKEQDYQNIVLAGHSLGTIKVVRYLFEGKHKDDISKLILLAPFDKNVFMQIKAGDKWDSFIEVAQQKIADGKGQELVPVPEYEDFPMTYETFLSWYNKEDISCLWDFYRKDYDFPLLKEINIPVKVILGDNDEFVNYPDYDVSSTSALKTLEEKIAKCDTTLIEDCNHTYEGKEFELAKEIISFTN